MWLPGNPESEPRDVGFSLQSWLIILTPQTKYLWLETPDKNHLPRTASERAHSVQLAPFPCLLRCLFTDVTLSCIALCFVWGSGTSPEGTWQQGEPKGIGPEFDVEYGLTMPILSLSQTDSPIVSMQCEIPSVVSGEVESGISFFIIRKWGNYDSKIWGWGPPSKFKPKFWI